jgi:hypothetical protein
VTYHRRTVIPINIPIRFQFSRTPCVWEIRTVVGARHEPERMLFAKIDLRRSDIIEKPQLLDGWECRRDFFRLPQNENSLLGFLSKVGVWHSWNVPPFVHWPEEMMEHCRAGHPPPLSVDGMWVWRESLGESLVNRKKFIETHAPARPRARTAYEILFPGKFPGTGHESNKFDLSFELEKHPEGVVAVMEARQMLLTTVYVDIVRGLGFKYCQSCGTPFHVGSRPEKRFCEHNCAKREGMRKLRREALKAKRKLRGH